MVDAALRFYEAISNASDLSERELCSYFCYLLTVELGHPSASAKAIDNCFLVCDLRVPKRTASYLSEGIKSQQATYVKVATGGYRLHRSASNHISSKLGSFRIVTQTSAELRSLEGAFPDGAKKKFLSETVDCFEANANRAAVVMCWILTIDHLFEFVLTHHLTAFNSALAATPDKRIKKVGNKEDLSELKETKFIDLCRAANIISNDVRKILDDALGVRNTAAHPSGVEIARTKTVSVIEDLVVNVIRKFNV
ncbi:hypothetical protein [Rhizobium laguerreae]|uniref:hypothetical protein n=1 Tax=Rhizobium laguerreae TaxID=1076926 RepID=UPI001C9016C2|nr:hypothetical protein [Rhizobium laguerreae]MBY3136739.1 hypothetical protein [Rhizobium laguerreae]